MIKGEVNWGDVAMSGIMETVTGGLGSYLPNTKFGKGVVKFTNKVKDSISTGFKNISDKFDNALKKLGNAFSPEAVTPEGIRVKSPFGLDDVNASNIKYTEVQANYNKVMAEMDVDANNSLALYDPDFAKYQENPSEYFKNKGAGEAKNPVFDVSKEMYPNHAQMLENAQKSGHSLENLERGAGTRAAQKNRYNAQKEIRKNQGPPPSGFDYDEFPYASTKQGGAGAHIEPVPSTENQAVGRDLGQFYIKYGIKEGDLFDVRIVK